MSAPAGRTLGAATDALARALGSIQASLAEVNGQGRPLRERVLIELARAEAVRAAWLAEAVDVLQREPLPALDQVNLAAVVAAVAEALAPEHRLTGHGPGITRSEVPVKVFGDERLLTVAVGGMLQGMCALVDGRGVPLAVAVDGSYRVALRSRFDQGRCAAARSPARGGAAAGAH